MSSVVDAENATSAVRWELPSLGGPRGGGHPTARELDDLERVAYQEGVERGRKEGYVAGRAEALSHIQQFKTMLARFGRPLAELDSEIEQILVHLTTAVAAALWRGLAGPRPEMVEMVVREAIAALPAGARDVEVQVNAEDYAVLMKLAPEGGFPTRIVPNPVLNRGDVRVHCDSVRLDATLATRLANATEAMLDKGE